MSQVHTDLLESRTGLPKATWGDTVLALGPFLLLPGFDLVWMLLTPYFDVSIPEFGSLIGFSILGLFLIILVIGWVRDFPRWVFPYWGFLLLVGLYLQNFTGTLFGTQFTGSWLVWLPLVGVAVLGSLGRGGVQPIIQLLRSIWADWTSLSFTFYGCLPLMFLVAYEETRDTQLASSGWGLILAAGAILYMRSPTIWQRFTSLVAAFSLAWAAAMIHLAIYWHGRQDPGMRAPVAWADTLGWTGGMGVVLLAILVAPGLIGVLRRVIRPAGNL